MRTGERLELAGGLLDPLRVMLPAVDAEATTLFDKEDPHASSVRKYPPRALREAVVNAFAHRDDERVDPLRITAFLDRVEVLSPGGLPLGAHADELTSGTAPPRWRNQALAWFLTRLGYAEAEGQGLRTIESTLRQAGCPAAHHGHRASSTRRTHTVASAYTEPSSRARTPSHRRERLPLTS